MPSLHVCYPLLPGDDEATCTWEDEELEPGVKKKRKKKIRSPGRLTLSYFCTYIYVKNPETFATPVRIYVSTAVRIDPKSALSFAATSVQSAFHFKFTYSRLVRDLIKSMSLFRMALVSNQSGSLFYDYFTT